MKGKFARASVPTFVLKENKDEFGKVKLLKKGSLLSQFAYLLLCLF